MKAKYILLALGATLLSTSCSDFLQEDPKGQLTPTTFFATQEELDMATYALYSKVCQTQTNTNPTIPSWQGDDLTANPGSNKQAYAEVDAFHPANDNKGVEAAWSTSYVAIKAANYIIENGGKTPTTDEEINIAMGQAKFWRAINYFWLVRRFGPIPLILDTEVNYERTLAPVEEVYNQIVQDLTECKNLLPTSYSTAPRYLNGANIYITKQAAQATLGAVYMAMAGWPMKQTQYYASAATELKEVIDGVNAGTYEYILEPEYKHVYAPSHNYTNETVVGICFSRSNASWREDSQMTSSNLFESLGGWGDGFGEIKFWKEFPEGPRKDATFNPKILLGNTEGGELVDWWDERVPEQQPMYSIFSIAEDGGDYDYTKPGNTALMTNDHRHRLVRYSEVLLWYAESQARADGTPNAQAYECLNQVRERAGEEPVSGLSADAFINLAVQEHGWEVAGYWVALVTRRDDMMRLEMLEDFFNSRKQNAPIEVAPGITRQENVVIDAGQTWNGESSIYLPYPSSDSGMNPNLTR